MRAPTNEEDIVKIDTVPDSIVKTYAVPSSTWDLQDENWILSMKSNCSIDVKGHRFFTMERLFYALQLLNLGDIKFIGQRKLLCWPTWITLPTRVTRGQACA